MAQVVTYRPSTAKVTAASTEENNGRSAQIATDTLAKWNRFIAFGVVEGASGTALENAGVRVYQLATAAASLTPASLIATIFTDAQGEYGISLQTLTAPQVYAFESFTPGN